MHPLAHMMTGALIGQLSANPAVAIGGGLVSHFVLDVIPHTEGRTFRAETGKRASLLSPELVEAGLEFICGVFIIASIARCPAADGRLIALGTLGALLPDLIDQPLDRLLGIKLIHVRQLHWTVARRHAFWGILTQVAVAGTGGLTLLKLVGCL